MSKESLLFCASEVYPFAKTGGLADVAHSLPRALRDTYNIKVVMPLYSCINRKKYSIKSSYPKMLNRIVNIQQNYLDVTMRELSIFLSTLAYFVIGNFYMVFQQKDMLIMPFDSLFFAVSLLKY